MFKDIRKRASKVIPPRLVVLLVVIVLMAAILIERHFICRLGEESYQENFSLSIKGANVKAPAAIFTTGTEKASHTTSFPTVAEDK